MDHRDREPHETDEIRNGPAVALEEHRAFEQTRAIVSRTMSGEGSHRRQFRPGGDPCKAGRHAGGRDADIRCRLPLG